MSGLSSILYNKKGDEINVVAYASRTLTPVESTYTITVLECLSVIFGVKRWSNILLKSFTLLFGRKSLSRIERSKIGTFVCCDGDYLCKNMTTRSNMCVDRII